MMFQLIYINYYLRVMSTKCSNSINYLFCHQRYVKFVNVCICCDLKKKQYFILAHNVVIYFCLRFIKIYCLSTLIYVIVVVEIY